MMKSIFNLSLIALLLICFSANAQKKDLQTAKNRLKAGEYNEALEYLNKAMTYEKVQTSADAWETSYQVYSAIAANQPDLDPDASQKALNSLIKSLEIDPKYKLVNNIGAIEKYVQTSFSNGTKAYGEKNYEEAIQNFDNFNKLYKATKSTIYKEAPSLDTFNARASLYKAFAYQENGDDDQAIKTLDMLKSNPYLDAIDKENVYKSEILLYKNANNEDKMMETIDEANKALPGNSFTIDFEIDYYSSKGETNKLLDKINEAIAENPNNGSMYYNKGVILSNMANPAEGDGPENRDELLKESETALAKAAELNPDDPNVSYMQGYIFYNEATKINEKIANASNSELPSLTKERLVYFNQALPFIEKTYTQLNSYPEGKLPGQFQATAYNVGIALKSIYGLSNDMDKINEVNAFLKKYNLN